MKIAVPSDNGKNIAAHFGRCNCFCIYTIENRKISSKEIKLNNFTEHGGKGSKAIIHKDNHLQGRSHHSHGPVLKALKGCNLVICKGMGFRIAKDLKNIGIKLIFTTESSADQAVKLYLEGKLIESNQNFCSCSH
ncbi:MAG TPA: iron-molybdenum cofactor biosynthesis protein [Clostridia bacterium]|nr:iron-molybdenum cofactor biosynthesis protein [Clostridia bacterium]